MRNNQRWNKNGANQFIDIDGETLKRIDLTEIYSAIYMQHHFHHHQYINSGSSTNWSLSLTDNEARCLVQEKNTNITVQLTIHINR